MNDETLLTNLNLTKSQAKLFTELKLTNINDLLTFYPSKYEIIKETNLVDNDKVVIEVIINGIIKYHFFQGRKNRIYFSAIYQNKNINVVIFNQYYLLKQLKKAKIITIIGLYTKKNNTIIVNNVKFDLLKNIEGIYPKYNLDKKYSSNNFNKHIYKIFTQVNSNIENIIPSYLINKYHLLSKKDAIYNIHFSNEEKVLNKARNTIIYEEFFLYSLKSIIQSQNKILDDKFIKKIQKNDIQNLLSKISFKLSDDQRKVLNEIYLDFISNKKMNRLLLADVGAGKTLVALISAYLMILAGYQVAFIAPTTILAKQHYDNAVNLFSKVNISIAILTSNSINKNEIINKIKDNKIDLIIGTHSLYQDDVVYNNLKYVIFDEQQRFGVHQRIKLRNKGIDVEQLMLSATPIPRTLAQVCFSSIDISIMKNSLSFKKPILSYYFQSKTIKPFYQKMIALLEEKQQVYIITPLVEESMIIDTNNAINIYNNLKKFFKDKYKIALVHGKLKNYEKETIMNDFANYSYDILVATSIIEVGISVDNANCIIIYDAHRFGLSQLHQLRGRVGRSNKQGYCVFLSNVKDENTVKKLQFITNNNDGFKISEYDLKTRGPGDILGTRQSGLPLFNLANPVNDYNIYKKAYNDALEFYEKKDCFIKWLNKNKHILQEKDLNY